MKDVMPTKKKESNTTSSNTTSNQPQVKKEECGGLSSMAINPLASAHDL